VFSAGRDGDGGGEGGGEAQQRGEGAIAAARAAGGGGPGLIVSENRLTPLLVYTSIGLSALTPRCAATKRPFSFEHDDDSICQDRLRIFNTALT
jgi:hypothetical protein